MINDDRANSSWVARHLLDLNETCRKIILSSEANNLSHLGGVLRLDLDIGVWEERLKGRPETKQLGDARRELAFAIFAASTGLYRLAYAGLRVFLELSFAAVYFSANELHRRQWIGDRKDFSWTSALDMESGVLSKSFVREFTPEAVDDAAQYARVAAQCYRHCSQFVHGKDVTTGLLPQSLAYSSEIVTDWAVSGRHAAESVLYLLYCRYSAEIFDLEDTEVCNTLEHSFSHLRSIRSLLGLPVEGV
ncbi:hypothetical protein [Nonomuraea sp. NPDC005501]|uniref:hypothetical protein n=1 Tax=Nonomuraea sp. NPDC005501 TaxID=3156884 RepID=UPI0033B0AC98